MEKAENTKKELDFNRKDFINKNIEPYLALSEKELLQKKEEFKEKSSNPFDNNLYKISFINQILRCKNHIDLTNYEYQEKCHEYERLEIGKIEKSMYLELKETIETIRQKEALKHKGDEIWEALMNGKHNPQKITADEIRWINQENY